MNMTLTLSECDGLATCECGARIYGDSLNDTVLAWVKHVTDIPEHRERL